MADTNLYVFLHYKDESVKYNPWKKFEYQMLSRRYLCLQSAKDLLSGSEF